MFHQTGHRTSNSFKERKGEKQLKNRLETGETKLSVRQLTIKHIGTGGGERIPSARVGRNAVGHAAPLGGVQRVCITVDTHVAVKNWM